MSEGEFSVVEFYDDDYYAYVERWLDGESAVRLAKRRSDMATAKVAKIIITDGGDYTVFQWERGKGVTFPERQ
jgi:hypothetical protein